MWPDCTVSDKAQDKDGYARCFYKGRNDVMHRAVWDLVHGPLPHGMVVRHKCDNPPCFNLNHLELGTVGENNLDRSTRNPESWQAIRGEANQNSKLTEEQVKEIRSSKLPHKELAQKYGVGKTTIADIRRYKSWKHLDTRHMDDDRKIHSNHTLRKAA